MEIFIDTANVEDVARFSRFGIIEGVATNPAPITRLGRDFWDVVNER